MRDFFQTFFNVVNGAFVLYMVGYASFLFLSVAVGSSSLYGAKRSNFLKNELQRDYYVPVSIVVPAYNESVTIEATVRSLLALDYKLYEIIVVDDGSQDDTSKVVRECFQMTQVNRPIRRSLPCQPVETVFETDTCKVPLTLIRKKNGGKADALNMGINAARYPYFLCMDADSVLQRDSLQKIVRPILEDERVIAVGGAVRPCNGAEIVDGRVVKYGQSPCLGGIGDQGVVGTALAAPAAVFIGPFRHLNGVNNIVRERRNHNGHGGRAAAVAADIVCPIRLIGPTLIQLIEVNDLCGSIGKPNITQGRDRGAAVLCVLEHSVAKEQAEILGIVLCQ